jgi:uncharacterized protein YcnI
MKRLVIVPAVGVLALVLAATASAHANLSPPIALAKTSQIFTLAVPTEKSGTTTKVELVVPVGFAIDSFFPSPGWKRQTSQTTGGELTSVTWSGGSVPTGEDAAFSFLAATDSAKTYMFGVKQTYSDGSVVDWSGPESSDTPAPTIDAKSSLGGGGNSTLGVIALVVAGVALVVAVGGLLARTGGGRPLT